LNGSRLEPIDSVRKVKTSQGGVTLTGAAFDAISGGAFHSHPPMAGPIALSALIGRIVELGFEWGVTDGT
jgi:hypothetical protein